MVIVVFMGLVSVSCENWFDVKPDNQITSSELYSIKGWLQLPFMAKN